MLPKRNRKFCAIKVLQWDELIEIHVIICAQCFHFCSVYIQIKVIPEFKTGMCDILLGKASITL